MKRPLPFVNEAVTDRDFKCYIFDWDDNILHMPTKIRLEHLGEDGAWVPVEMSTATFALVRADVEHNRPPSDGGWTAAFADFEDKPGCNTFIEDTIAAMERVDHGDEPLEYPQILTPETSRMLDSIGRDAFFEVK